MNVEKKLSILTRQSVDNFWWCVNKINSPFTVENELMVSKILSLRALELPIEKALPTRAELKRSRIPSVAVGLVLRNAGDELRHAEVLDNLSVRFKSKEKQNVIREARQVIDRWNEELEVNNPYLASYNLEAGVLYPMLSTLVEVVPRRTHLKAVIRDEGVHIATNAIISFGVYKEQNKARLRELVKDTNDWIYS